MSVTNGKQWIETLRKRWILFSLGRIVILSFSTALLAAVISSRFFGPEVPVFLVVLLLVFLLVFSLFAWQTRFWKISEKEVTSYIDLNIEAVEESSGLLLKPQTGLSFLEQLQAEKVNAILVTQKQPQAPLKQLKFPLICLAAVLVLSYAISKIPFHTTSGLPSVTITKPDPAIKENIPAAVSSFQVIITPPVYIRKAARLQHQFTLMAESGATVKWKISTSQGLKKLSFIFNDSETVPLKKVNADGTEWSLSRVMVKPGFYQVLIDGKRSDFYQVGIIADQPVSIKIKKPAQHSTIDIGQPQRVNLSVLLQDDYGISTAYISATMASGKGEAVSFTEKKISFNVSFQGKKTVQMEKLIQLGELGMKPGDELYFYIAATDNHGQSSRSDMYIVSIQDTTELMSMAGIDNGVNLVPEYFRSERQIIIDTEKLLKEKASLTDTEFKKRSNDLGVDQKMLRLRYGKFLGEESETNIGGEHEGEGHADHDHHEESAAAGDVSAIMDQYAHKHDNAEDATFFEPQLKAQLKATLTEMWNAELRLRTYRPEEALPYEYKALRLLKDLQQKSRAYVAKSTFKISTLKPEKRLTGELMDIKAGTNKSTANNKDEVTVMLKQAISILENKKAGKVTAPQQLHILYSVQQELTSHAAVSPAIYLPALKSLKKVIASGQKSRVAAADIASAEKGINHLLGKQEVIPSPQTNTSSSKLTRSYFNHLKKLMP